ncbi:MAG TPA: signal peptidase I [Thiotrichales bacterium]|nr:signal peptidase I [Thiotrichales bacterium]
MYLDFPTILFFAALFTGGIWLIDARLLAPRRRQEEGESGREPVLVEYARSLFPIILIVLLLRSFLVEPFRIPSGSMMPTLLAGDFILVNKFAYGIRLPVINRKVLEIGEPQRGDVVVFRYPEDPSTDFIKRVIGLPGDHIRYVNKQLVINGKPLEYSNVGIYEGKGAAMSASGSIIRSERIGEVEHQVLLHPSNGYYNYPCMRNGEFTVPAGHYFVMGDNRDRSNDSRFWCGVPEENLVGKAFMIWMNWEPDGGGVNWERIGTIIH